jgi:hypothetical protein
MPFSDWIKAAVPKAAADFRAQGLRYSYLLMVPIVLAAFVINLLVAHHGWTVWPFVAAAAILLYVHEAAERNGQGIPPFHVYALFAGGTLAWIVVSLCLSIVNPFIILIAVGGILFYCLKAYLAQREAEKVVEQRRAEGRCVHCGEIADIQSGYCGSCGEEPDPQEMQTQRIAAVVRNSAKSGRMRAILKTETLASAARKKEGALLNSRMRNGRPRK